MGCFPLFSSNGAISDAGMAKWCSCWYTSAGSSAVADVGTGKKSVTVLLLLLLLVLLPQKWCYPVSHCAVAIAAVAVVAVVAVSKLTVIPDWFTYSRCH